MKAIAANTEQVKFQKKLVFCFHLISSTDLITDNNTML